MEENGVLERYQKMWLIEAEILPFDGTESTGTESVSVVGEDGMLKNDFRATKVPEKWCTICLISCRSRWWVWDHILRSGYGGSDVGIIAKANNDNTYLTNPSPYTEKSTRQIIWIGYFILQMMLRNLPAVREQDKTLKRNFASLLL